MLSKTTNTINPFLILSPPLKFATKAVANAVPVTLLKEYLNVIEVL
jgi:hypothetical protein